ncbi:MAG: amidohydrolase family protein [Acidilobus sp.]
MALRDRMYIRASLALVGDGLEARRWTCVSVSEEGVIESVEGWGSCPSESTGGSWAVLLPQPADSHVHSADGAFPEFGVDAGLHELVAPPGGLKYRFLSTLGRHGLISSIARTYWQTYRYGVGLIIDFREGGGEGCRAAQLARTSLPSDLDVVVLGTPGPGFPGGCSGLGLSSPLDYPPSIVSELASSLRPSMTHVAEDPLNRSYGDLELALRAGFDAVVHGTYLSRDELESLVSSKVALVMCPRSNLWHSLRPPPVTDAIEAGVTLGLGTDNAAWALPNPWAEAEAALLIARMQGGRLAQEGVLRALFVGGYEAVGLRPRTIEEGRRAHAVIVNGEGSGILSAVDFNSAIIKRAGGWLVARVDGARVVDLSSYPARRL